MESQPIPTTQDDLGPTLTSANPNQYLQAPKDNSIERYALRNSIDKVLSLLSSRKSIIHQYVAQKYYELKFSGIADDIFSRIREKADKSIGSVLPFRSLPRFMTIYNPTTRKIGQMQYMAAVECYKTLLTLSIRHEKSGLSRSEARQKQ